jgi:hypothetical protein
MAKVSPISEALKQETIALVEEYNKKNNTEYAITFKGKFCYLSRIEKKQFVPFLGINKLFNLEKLAKNVQIVETKIGRLEWIPEEKRWEFAVFRYSREIYDPNEFLFPGRKELDGTITGAMNCGQHLYP